VTPSSEFDGVEGEAGSEGDHRETDSGAASTVNIAYPCHNLRFNQVVQPFSHQLRQNWIPTNLRAKVLLQPVPNWQLRINLEDSGYATPIQKDRRTKQSRKVQIHSNNRDVFDGDVRIPGM
jgi:hypothetical protein